MEFTFLPLPNSVLTQIDFNPSTPLILADYDHRNVLFKGLQKNSFLFFVSQIYSNLPERNIYKILKSGRQTVSSHKQVNIKRSSLR